MDDHAFNLSLKMEMTTKLSILRVFASEAYQIANYGMGGQYSTHLDSHGYYEDAIETKNGLKQLNHNRVIGDRFVTIMGYLSDVEYGGRTAFPLTGNVAEAKRGDTILWFNLLSDGRRDKLTYHGGCPVLIGSKWITNKWVYYNDQFWSYPCGLRPGLAYNVLDMWRKVSY